MLGVDDLDRPVAAHRPDALQHHLGGLEVALQSLLGDDADQVVGQLDAQAIELADRDGLLTRT
ncbi:MAG: hypothetical protein J0J01_30395 [Reyranella sp.]|uniref:hypothetical protein n=1 Tax=Reyranella sp. TaxID=1929291 RepID=UPI001AC1B396|nr:hypothetical protein [Reyranella sp.]MBN9091250.1 hypothetical protein [Reyranella sp.]